MQSSPIFKVMALSRNFMINVPLIIIKSASSSSCLSRSKLPCNFVDFSCCRLSSPIILGFRCSNVKFNFWVDLVDLVAFVLINGGCYLNYSNSKLF